MQPERRFVFRGNAAAVSGQIYRPDITIFEATGASSLTVSGGISQGRLGKTALGKFGTVGAGRTRAEGVFVDRGQATELTHHRIKAEQVPTQTKVEVEVQGIEVGLAPDPILRVERLAATMEGRSPRSTEEPSIRPRDVAIAGVRVDDFILDVELDHKLLDTHDTHEKLRAAVEGSRDADGEPRFLVHPVEQDGRRPPSEYTTYGSIVRGLTWRDGRVFPGSKIDGHSVWIPEFGRIFLGEVLVSSFSRRLTLLRLDLGSPIGGFMAFAELETNGTWYP